MIKYKTVYPLTHNEVMVKEFVSLFEEFLSAEGEKKEKLMNNLINSYDYAMYIDQELRKGLQKVSSMCDQQKPLEEIKESARIYSFTGFE